MPSDANAAGVGASSGGRGGSGQTGGASGGQGDDDAAVLIQFLEVLDADLQDMIADPEFLPEDLRALATAAYGAGGVPAVETMVRMLRDGWDDHFTALDQHGLTGDQLKFKMRVHGLAKAQYEAFRGFPRPTIEVVVPGEPRQRFEDQVPWADVAAKDYLDCSDIILESLSSALGGAGAALIEIKKMIEWLKGAGWGWMRRFFGVR